jgi:hypothetical protein
MRRQPLGVLLLPLLLAACADAPAAEPGPSLPAVQLLSSAPPPSPSPTAAAPRAAEPPATPTRPRSTATATPPPPSPTATRPAPTATRRPASPTPRTSPSPVAPRPFSDPLVVQIGLKSKLPVTAVQILNATNDPDKLLGKPNGYAAKIAFQDPRIGNAHGFVELFADDATLDTRLRHLQGQHRAGSIGPITVGKASKTIFRLPKGLSAAQLKTYQRAFGA